MKSFRAKFSSKWDIPVPASQLSSRYSLRFFLHVCEVLRQISFWKVSSKREKEICSLSRVLCKLNHVAFHSLDTRYINTRRKGSMTRARPAFLWIVGESTSIIETILSANIVQVTQWKSYKIVHALVNRKDETTRLLFRSFISGEAYELRYYLGGWSFVHKYSE